MIEVAAPVLVGVMTFHLACSVRTFRLGRACELLELTGPPVETVGVRRCDGVARSPARRDRAHPDGVSALAAALNCDPAQRRFSGRWAVSKRASELGVSRSLPSRTISPARFWVYLSMSEDR
jgi:hypothetical protein